MKNFKSYLSLMLLAAVALMSMPSCSEEKLGESIFIDEPEVDENAYTYKLDKWLFENYKKVYNVDFRYKMQDVGTNMDYNLVPATFDNSINMAVLTKYLWFDAYNEVANDGIDFLKANGPRIIHLIGSPAYNPTTGTRILGLAEGGIKISLYQINQMRVNDFNQMNEDYFKTMHHEFAHILHQTKSYPTVFNTYSVGQYDGNNWQDRQDGVVNSLGFVTPYASSAPREDFAETMANYIVKTDAQWAHIMDLASRGWGTNSSEDDLNAVYYCYYYLQNNVAGDSNKVYIPESSWSYNDPLHGDSTMVLFTGNQKVYQKAVEPFRTDSTGVQYDAFGYKVGQEDQMARGTYFALDAANQMIPIYVHPAEDNDGYNGPEIILKKVEVVRTWLRDAWGVDLDKLREVVQRRQLDYNIETLRKQVLGDE